MTGVGRSPKFANVRFSALVIEVQPSLVAVVRRTEYLVLRALLECDPPGA